MTGTMTVANARIFDGVGAQVLEGDIRIEDGVIAEIGPGIAPAGEVLDVRGAFVTPGFIDNHFHAYGTSLDLMEMEASKLSLLAHLGARRLTRALHRGFTTVRDVAGGDIGLARAIDAGLFPSPRYYFTGPALSQTGGHGDGRAAHLDVCVGHGGAHTVQVVDGVENLRVAVRERLRTGAHAIKIMTSGGVVSPTDPIRVPQYSAEEIAVVTAEASRRGSYVAAHAYSPEAIVHSVENGVRSIEHGNLLDPDSARLMAEHGAVLVPTLVTYFAMAEQGASLGMSEVALGKNAAVLESGKQAIEIATAAGVIVGFGTDLMGSLEVAQLRGLRIQHEVQGTLELLRSLTSRNAEILQGPKVGRIQQGFAGDLVILASDPFDDPAVLWSETIPRRVVKAGALIA